MLKSNMERNNLAGLGLNTEEAFEALFNLVKNAANWKKPTRGFQTKSLLMSQVMEKVLNFYTGGHETDLTKDVFTITSKGYYNNIGA